MKGKIIILTHERSIFFASVIGVDDFRHIGSYEIKTKKILLKYIVFPKH